MQSATAEPTVERRNAERTERESGDRETGTSTREDDSRYEAHTLPEPPAYPVEELVIHGRRVHSEQS